MCVCVCVCVYVTLCIYYMVAIIGGCVLQLTEEPLVPLLVHEIYTSCVCRHTTLGVVWGHATPKNLPGLRPF